TDPPTPHTYPRSLHDALPISDGRTVRSDGQMIRVSKQAQGSRRQNEHFFEEFEQGIESHRRRRFWILLKALSQPGDLPRTCCRSLIAVLSFLGFSFRRLQGPAEMIGGMVP